MNEENFAKEPMYFHGEIPVFSESCDYTDNYEKISTDHLDHYHQHGTNPFIPEELWVQTEISTVDLIKKYAKPGDVILDVGVGMGRLLSHFPYLQRYGMDISFGYLKIALNKGINVCYSLIEDMPYREHFFDVVVCTDVLEHVLDLNFCCTKIFSVLKKGGILIVRVPYKENLHGYIQSEYNPYEYVHMRNFDEYSLQLLFERIFRHKVVEITKAGYIPYDTYQKHNFPFPQQSRLLRLFLKGIRYIDKPIYAFLLQKLYNPVEINVVVSKVKE